MRLSIRHVSKRYANGVRALHDLSLDLGPGLLGLLGPNGAGKSTLMSVLATVTAPTSGAVVWDDGTREVDVLADPTPLRRTLGYLPQDFGVYPELTAEEFLAYVAAAKGLAARPARRRIDELLALVNLGPARRQRLGGFSGGMRQRVGIAQALLNDPKLLIVDEPTAGLDPEERVRFRNLLLELAADRVVILSTHIVSDVEASAERIALVRAGELVALDRPEALVAAVEGRVWTLCVGATEAAALRRRLRVSEMVRRSDGVQLRVVADERPHRDAVPERATLEDAYLWFNQPAGEGAPAGAVEAAA